MSAVSSCVLYVNTEDPIAKTLTCVQDKLKRVKEELKKGRKSLNVESINEHLEHILNELPGVQQDVIKTKSELIRMEKELHEAKSTVKRMEHDQNKAKAVFQSEYKATKLCHYLSVDTKLDYAIIVRLRRMMEKELDEAKSTVQRMEQDLNKTKADFQSNMGLVRKIHGHKHKDEADPKKPVGKYSHLFKRTFDPIYDALANNFDLKEDDSLFVVNRMFQITYTECTELLLSKMTKQLKTLFVRQQGDVDVERMEDTQYAFALLLHAANIKDYHMTDDIDKIMTILCKNELIKSVSKKMSGHLEVLIKQAMEIIQSLLILVPPLVVDCSPHPDMGSGAYGKKAVHFNAADYVTTQSALFYSYQGESVAKNGLYSPIASISHPVKVLLTFRSLNKGDSHITLDGKEQLDDWTESENATRSKENDNNSDNEENENVSSKKFPSKTYMNTALAAVQNVNEYKFDKCTQTNVIQNDVGTQITPPYMQITRRSLSPNRMGDYHHESGGRHNSTPDLRYNTLYAPVIRKVSSESEENKRRRAALREKSQAQELLRNKIPGNAKSFQHANHGSSNQNTTHIPEDTLYTHITSEQQSDNDYNECSTNPCAADIPYIPGDTELCEFPRVEQRKESYCTLS